MKRRTQSPSPLFRTFTRGKIDRATDIVVVALRREQKWETLKNPRVATTAQSCRENRQDLPEPLTGTKTSDIVSVR